MHSMSESQSNFGAQTTTTNKSYSNNSSRSSKLSTSTNSSSSPHDDSTSSSSTATESPRLNSTHSQLSYFECSSPVGTSPGFAPMATSTPSFFPTSLSTSSIPPPPPPQNSNLNSTTPRSTAKRKQSLNVMLQKCGASHHQQHPTSMGSSDSLNKTSLSEPGLGFFRRKSSPGSIPGDDSSPGAGCDEKGGQSYKVQRKNYRREKQRVTEELSSALKDPSITILSGALKVRGKLKSWTKLWAILKPGLLLLYKSEKVKSSTWVATVLLHCCKLMERPSKKEGFCFKVFHPLDQSIWAPKGPDGETMGAVVQPLPTTYLICRAPSADNGKYWMDGLELATTCSSLLVRAPKGYSEVMEGKSFENEPGRNVPVIHPAWKEDDEGGWGDEDEEGEEEEEEEEGDSETSQIYEEEGTETLDEEEDLTTTPQSNNTTTTTNNSTNATNGSSTTTNTNSGSITTTTNASSGAKRRRKTSMRGSGGERVRPRESHYVPNTDEFSISPGEQYEELADENKSLLWFLIKQVRPGMDLSRVVLPTFILEPRSFLDKLSDYYYHADYLSLAVVEDDPFTRMKYVIRWYLSGFYKKPKGLKKPYNPVLGETFRCMWLHPNGSKTFYIAEQVSHHPPISAFYVSNKQDGFAISVSITAKSKFYGNSTSAILEGVASLTLLPRGETYELTMPYAHCKGILLGTLSMELGGNVMISCPKTGYHTEMEFKLKSFLSLSDKINSIVGKIKLGREVLATIDGHWDHKIMFNDKRSHEKSVLWEVSEEMKNSRLVRYTIPVDEQSETESEALWYSVSAAILNEDQVRATEEKTKLEERQREGVRARAATNTPWTPQHFIFEDNCWKYKYEDLRPWDVRNDIYEYEVDYKILTHRKHDTSIVRDSSHLSTDLTNQGELVGDSLNSTSATPSFQQRESYRNLVELLRQLLTRQMEQSEQIEVLRGTVAKIESKLTSSQKIKMKDPFRMTNTVLVVMMTVALQLFILIYWFGDGKIIS